MPMTRKLITMLLGFVTPLYAADGGGGEAGAGTAGGGAAGAGTAGGGAAGGGATPPWYQGLPGVDNEFVGHLTNKGWDKKTATEVAIEAVKSWKSAEKMVGVPANEIIRKPKDLNDTAGWQAFYEAAGKPKAPTDYDFSNVKRPDGTPVDPGFAEFMRTAAFQHNLSKDGAVAFANDFVKWESARAASAQTEAAGRLALEKTELAKNWGPNYAANEFVAKQAAAALGVTPEAVAALEKVVGYAKVMDMFRSIGAKIGEDKFVLTPNPAGQGVMTRESAVATLADLKADREWVKRYLAGGVPEKQQMHALTKIISAQ